MQQDFDKKSILLYFDAINSLAKEGLLHITKDGFSLSSVDTANVAFISATYKQIMTDVFDVAIDCQKIKSTIGALTSKNITMNFDKTLHIKGGKVERDIRFLEPTTLRKEQNIPSINFPICIEVPTIDFVEIIESIDKMGVAEGSMPIKVQFKYNKNKFVIDSENDLHEITKLEFDTISTEKGSGEQHSSFFSFDYILDMAKMIKKINTDNIKIYIGTNIPFKIEVNTDNISIAWLLAPRIDTD
jgi:proliferating cell nuclear antigen